MDLNLKSVRAKFNELYESVEAVVRNEIEDDRNPQAAVRRVILAYSGAAMAANLSPIPFTETALLTPIQVAMVLHVGKRLGQDVSLENAGEIFKQIIGAVGLSVAARRRAARPGDLRDDLRPGSRGRRLLCAPRPRPRVRRPGRA